MDSYYYFNAVPASPRNVGSTWSLRTETTLPCISNVTHRFCCLYFAECCTGTRLRIFRREFSTVCLPFSSCEYQTCSWITSSPPLLISHLSPESNISCNLRFGSWLCFHLQVAVIIPTWRWRLYPNFFICCDNLSTKKHARKFFCFLNTEGWRFLN